MDSEWSVVRPRRSRKSRSLGGGSKGAESSALGHTGSIRSVLTEGATVDTVVGSLRRLQRRLASSEFGEHVLATVQAHYADVGVQAIVAYGIGNFSMHDAPLLQLALLLVLKEQLQPEEPVTVSDPVFNELEVRVLEAIGLKFKASDDGRKPVQAATLFYMPHCEHFMYSNVVAANAGENRAMVAIIGNSFRGYADRRSLMLNTEEAGSDDHVVRASKIAKEAVLWSERYKQHPRECHDELISLESAFNDSVLIIFPQSQHAVH